MATLKISQLTAAAAATGTQELEVNESGTSKKITGAQLAAYVEGEVSSSPTFTGQVSVADGTAGSPSITNTGDTNTGIYFPAEDEVAIATGGTERFKVNSAGLVTFASAGATDTALRGFTTTATAAGTTTLTSSSTLYQLFTGTSTQTVTLPVTSTLALGWSFHIVNNSTGNLTVNSSGGNLVITILPGTTAMVTCILTSGTTAASWEAGYTDFSTATGTGSVVLSASPTFTGTPAAPTASGGTNTTQIATTAFVQTALGSAGGMTLLGTINTTSGASANISGLTLTSYKQLVLVFDGVSHNDSGTQRSLLLGTSTSDDITITTTQTNSFPFRGIVWVDLNAGIGAAFISSINVGGFASPITTASTSVSVAPSGGSFNAGSVRVYGVK